MSKAGERKPPVDDSGETTRLHPTVMTKEVIEYLKPVRGTHLWVDATLGTAGHSVALCEALEGEQRQLLIDRFNSSRFPITKVEIA